MRFPRYPKYKPSGVEWLGEVPEHWVIDRLKRSVASCRNGVWGAEPNGGEDDIPCVRVADFDRQGLRVGLLSPTMRSVSPSEREGRALEWGNLLLEKSGGGEQQPVGCAVRFEAREPAVCSNFVARIELARGMDSSFWRYAHAAMYAVGRNTVAIKQTSGIQNLDQQQYLDERVAFPPPCEQRAIACFLERGVAAIDELLAEQSRLIELLKEKRQAAISHAVIKGLNPNVPMRPSAVEGLGDVPAHWELKPLKHVADIDNAGSYGTEPEGAEIVLPVATTAQIDPEGRFTTELMPLRGFSARLVGRFACSEGDVLVVKSSGSATNIISGKAGLVCADTPVFVFSNFLMRVRPRRTAVIPMYIFALLRSHLTRQRVERMCSTTTYPNLRVGEYTSAPLPCPPLHEQNGIVAFLREELAKVDALVAEAQLAITLLRERRSALISAAVTGQIDVRNLVPSEVA